MADVGISARAPDQRQPNSTTTAWGSATRMTSRLRARRISCIFI